MKERNVRLTLISILLLCLFLYYADKNFNAYQIRVLNLCAIYTVLGLSMNLINGFTGLFSLGHAGFMAIGAYTCALLTMPVAVKDQNFFLAPINETLREIVLPYPAALLIGGILAALIAFLIGAPVLRLRGDYLGIATLGFAEIIRIVITNLQTITNGAIGFKGIPAKTNLWWSFGIATFTTVFLLWLIKSSYGRAFKAIREDEIAAEAMGVSLFKHKVLSFVIGAFFAGVGGGLLGNLLGAINPLLFRFTLTFNILLIIVLGGMGSITGTVISAFVVTIGQEALRFLDQPFSLGFVQVPGISGLRMVVFSALLMLVVLFFSRGLMGTSEFSWDYIIDLFKRLGKPSGKPLSKGGTK
ncbi:MAG: branched-chain amino acid ABC transporter permease [Clostridia bacterium]